ncbi:hypothetical protein A3731_00855 [Roseovarius sp. HI0049]|nr:hypothetical protein A3731_00855 [Roseovarius sp. HI0049]
MAGHLARWILAGALAVWSAQAGAGEGMYNPDGLVRTSLRYSEEMFDRQYHVPNKIARMFLARSEDRLEPGALYLGGRFVATHIWERTNTAGRFPILSRLPPTHTGGTSDGYGVINEISVHATLVLPMVTAFAQGEYTEVEYPGQKPIQLRKYWVAIGDPDVAPVYLAFGRKTVNFGNFATYAPFTHSHSAHYFWPQSDEPVIELGYVTPRTELAFTLIPAHRGLRVLSSPRNDGAFSNFAVNGSHRFELGRGRSLRLGAGYLHGTIYDSVIAHHPPGRGINRVWNGLWDVNAVYSTPRFDLMAEFTRTLHDWPATGHHVQATTIQGRWRSELFGRPAVWSASFSRGVQGARGLPWEKMEQAILGLELEVAPHVRIGAEYMYNEGFVPLILPRVTSVAGVKSHTVIVGAELTF